MLVSQKEFVMSAVRHNADFNIFISSQQKSQLTRIVYIAFTYLESDLQKCNDKDLIFILILLGKQGLTKVK